MKYIIISLALVLFGAFDTEAQIKSVQTVVVKTPEIRCEACKARVETYLKRHDGLLETMINFRKGETRLKFLSDRTDIEQLKTAIANCGFDADDVTASPEAYQRLPRSCKKKSDGGGHPAPKSDPISN
ncbi:MAG: heavy-metal-associated domain-containing protein [Bacteroidota bacterium]|jgi:mercuric ion binding protein